MQDDQPQLPSTGSTQPNSVPLPSMPRPLTPLPPVDYSSGGVAPKPLDQAGLINLLKKADENVEPVLSHHPPIEVTSSLPGNIIEPGAPQTPVPVIPTPVAEPPKPAPLPQVEPPKPVTGPPPMQEVRPAPIAPKPPEPIVPPPPPPQPEPPKPTPPPPPKPPEPILPAVVPEILSPPPPPKPKRPKLHPIRLLKNRGLFFWPLVIVGVLFILLAAPTTRYRLAGLFTKHSFTVTVLDATTSSPVSDAQVSAGSISVVTNGNGQAVLPNLKPGTKLITVSKQYYDGEQAETLVPIMKQKTTPTITLHATGSLVSISITNLITKQALGGVDIKAAGTEAHTDSTGHAVLALPLGINSQSASLTYANYADSSTNLGVTDGSVSQNNVTLTPTGKAYYVSQLKNLIDVVSANLDGSSPKVLLGGTGFENKQTVLKVSPDGLYLGLIIRRTADPHSELYVINTSSGQTSEIESGNAEYKIYGWAGDSLVYLKTFDNIQPWQKGKYVLKSYNATDQGTVVISQTAGVGNAQNSAYPVFGMVLVAGNQIIYGSSWTSAGNQTPSLLTGKQNTLTTSSIDGSSQQIVASYDATSYSITYNQYAPNAVYLRRIAVSGAADQFFSYTAGQAQPVAAQISLAQFQQAYPVYLSSPSGKQSLWVQPKSGQNNLLVGDAGAQNASTVLANTAFSAYGWATNQYLLISKTGALYSIGIGGGTPIKIANYYTGN